MDKQIRWAVVGPGRIAEKVVQDVVHVDGAHVVAVASRSLQRAEDFAGRHDVERAYGSYAEVLADPDVDVLYIATPHPQHAPIALAALKAGKALLVEKSFTATVAGAEEIINTATARGVFAMEAMWTRFLPHAVRIRQLVAEGGIEALPGVRAWLEKLKTAGWRMAVASSAPSENLGAIIAALSLEGVFDALVSGEQVSFGKPHPAVFLAAAEAVGVPPERCVVVEDAPPGVEAGKRGGMQVIGVGPRHAELGADVGVERLDQLPEDAFDRLVGP